MNIAKNSMAVLNTAVSYAGLDNYDIYDLTVLCENGLYSVSFTTDVMDYLFYVEAETLEVLGFDSAPVEPCERIEALCA